MKTIKFVQLVSHDFFSHRVMVIDDGSYSILQEADAKIDFRVKNGRLKITKVKRK